MAGSSGAMPQTTAQRSCRKIVPACAPFWLQLAWLAAQTVLHSATHIRYAPIAPASSLPQHAADPLPVPLPSPSRSIRRLNWHFDMVSMLGLLLLVLPYYHCYFALSSKLPPLRAGVGAAALWCAGVAAFWRLGGAVPGIPAAAGWRGLTMLEVGQGVG